MIECDIAAVDLQPEVLEAYAKKVDADLGHCHRMSDQTKSGE
jgi:hypothetical protein